MRVHGAIKFLFVSSTLAIRVVSFGQIPLKQIEVEVQDISGASVPSAEVKIKQNSEHSVHTDISGRATIFTEIGAYDLFINADGFSPVAIHVSRNSLTFLRVALEPAFDSGPVIFDPYSPVLDREITHEDLPLLSSPSSTKRRCPVFHVRYRAQ